ncbi:hypothetical protein [Aurantiacibacter gilvus]|uniref:CTP synthetase n=1 Tax=Aurantiacibacter gilvus TaxID=3139141 RepID=A0ABU9II19_9SPHN
MFRMMMILLPIIATTLMGMAIIAVLTMDMQAGWKEILLAAVAGLVVSLPISWVVGKAVVAKTGWDS